MVFREENAFGGTDHAQCFGMDLPNKEGRAVPEYVVVVRSLAGIDQKQAASSRDPVLLGIVTP